MTSPTSSTGSSSAQSWSRHQQEEIINAYEAEEEHIINVLNRKLEKLREEKIQLENTLEAESESHVNRLSRELSVLRMQLQNPSASTSNHHHPSAVSNSPATRIPEPSPEVMLDSLRRENESLRNRLVDIERDYIRMVRLNEIYREELIEHRNQLGIPVDNLVGLAETQSSSHRYPSRRTRTIAAPRTTTTTNMTTTTTTTTNSIPVGLPIPRASSQIHLASASSIQPPLLIPTSSSSYSPPSSDSSSSSSSSSSSLDSVSTSLFSPPPPPPPTATTTSTNHNHNHTSHPTSPTQPPSLSSSISTNLTTPATSNDNHNNNHNNNLNTPNTININIPDLTYPSVPPPSLSSSFGSPVISYFPQRDRSRSRGGSVGSGSGRVVVESGSLVRSRAGSVSNPAGAGAAGAGAGAAGAAGAGAGAVATTTTTTTTGSGSGRVVVETGSLIRSRAGSTISNPTIPSDVELEFDPGSSQ